METKQQFINALENKLHQFDKKVAYITSALERDTLNNKPFFIKRMNDINLIVQDAFAMYKKIKLSPNENWTAFQTQASDLFNKLEQDFAEITLRIKKQEWIIWLHNIFKKSKNLFSNAGTQIKDHPCTSIVTALSIGFAFGKLLNINRINHDR